MKRALLFALLLAACREDAVQATDPVALTADSVGYFCQMTLLEHEGPKAQVHLEGLPGTPLFFSQVRDAVTYARLPEQSHPILAIWVNDMGAAGATWDEPGAENWIDAKTAHFVVGSGLAGGMGAPEFVPFSRLEDAAEFARTNGGTVMGLDAIPDSALIAPEAEATAEDSDFTRRLKALSDRAGG